jgi:5-formyltetrahydrofolate cyclo-ligase
MRLEQQKKELRFFFRQRAELFQSHESPYQVERLNENLIQFFESQSGIWAAFKGDSHEPRLDKVILVSKHINWVYPKINGDDLEFVAAKKFVVGKYGIEEPVDGVSVNIKDIQGFLIPGVAFDRAGFRLGRGKGYYDRVLSKVTALKVGVCFGFQIFDRNLPHASFDMKVDQIISEQGRWPCKST